MEGTWRPGELLCVDEAMVVWRGNASRMPFTVCEPNKPDHVNVGRELRTTACADLNVMLRTLPVLGTEQRPNRWNARNNIDITFSWGVQSFGKSRSFCCNNYGSFSALVGNRPCSNSRFLVWFFNYCCAPLRKRFVCSSCYQKNADTGLEDFLMSFSTEVLELRLETFQQCQQTFPIYFRQMDLMSS